MTRGLLTGQWSAEQALDPSDMRAHSPRYVGANLQHNLALVDAVRAIAEGQGISVAQLAIAWVLARGPDIVPLVGARRPDRLAEALGALSVRLDDATLTALEAALPPGVAAGSRYPEAGMAQLDSER